MKSFNLKGVILFFIAMLLITSCGVEGENVTGGTSFGIIRMDLKTGYNILDIEENLTIYNSQFNVNNPDDCLLVTFEIDHDRPENSPENFATNGYYWATVSANESINQGEVISNLGDPSTALSYEVAITEPNASLLTYIKGYLFFWTVLKNIPANNVISNLSLWYDENKMVSEGHSQGYYDVYLRAQARWDGNMSTGNVMLPPHAYEIKDYMEKVAAKEKQMGGSLFKLRFHFVSEISEDGELTWDSIDSIDIPVSAIIP